MAVQEQTPYIEHVGNGVTTSFELKFECEKKDHLIVTVNGLDILITAWSLVNGSVVFNTAPINGSVIVIQRNTPFARLTDYQSFNNSFRPQSVNGDFDRIWWKLQELGLADWMLGARIDNLKTYVDRKDDELKAYLMEEIRKQGVALDQLDEYYNYLMQRLAQIAVDKGWDASFIVDGEQTQKEINDHQKIINDLVIERINSIADLISYNARRNSQVVNVLSYHPDKNVGGDLFMWRSDLSKSLHDGGYIIDPLIDVPSLDEFNTYYAPQNSGAGVWVRLNNKADVYAEAYGIVKLSDDPTAVWSCAAMQQAILKASVRSSTDYSPKAARVMPGRYYTTNPIVLTQIGTYSARLPSLIGGSGGDIYEVEFIKTAENTVGSGYNAPDVDAVLYVAPKTGGSVYVYGENTKGFTFSRTTADVGYGYFAKDSVMGARGCIQAIGHGQNIWTDNCWMTNLGFMRSYQGLKGIAVRGGTSNFGGPMYVDMAKQHGFDFYGLSYSELECACDGVGASLAEGGIAYDFSYAKGVSGTFGVERHKGTEFLIFNTMGGTAKGRSYHTAPVATAGFKVKVDAGSSFGFDGYDWKETFANSTMTPAEIAKYRLTNKPLYASTSSISFNNCVLNDAFAKDGFVAQLDNKFIGRIDASAYVDNGGLITHTITINNTAFKRLCYLGQSSAVELLSANATNPTYGDRFYCNAFVLTEGTPNTIVNPKPNRIAKSAISTNQASPTILWYLSQGGAITSSHLRGYIDADGWLCVQHNVSGNGMDYRFMLAV